MRKKHLLELLSVIAFAFITTLITSSGLVSQYLNKPTSGHVFIGVSHYWEDYFYYLDQFKQGADGNWMTMNKFSSEQFPPTLFYLNHILLGKIGGLIGLQPYESYNISLILLKFIFIMLSYGCIWLVFQKQLALRISSFLLFLFSSSFPLCTLDNGVWKLVGLPVTRTAAPMMERFGNIPNTIMIDITFLMSFFLCYFIFFSQRFRMLSRMYQILFIFACLLSLSLTTLGDAVKTAVLLGGLGIVMIPNVFRYLRELENPRILSINKKSYYTIIAGVLILVSQILIVLYLSRTISRDPVYQYTVNWNIANQSAWSVELFKNPFVYIHSFGIILIPFLVGVIPFFRKYSKKPFVLLLISTTVIGFLGYHLPIEYVAPVPRFRFLFPSLYIGVSVIAIYVLQMVANRFHRTLFIIGILLIVFPSLITTYFSLKETTKRLNEPDYHFAYIPSDMYMGLLKIKELPDSNSTVLGNPTTSMDILIPGFTGKYTYSGHMLTTYNIQQKDDSAAKFYWNIYSEKDAKKFIEENNIQYIMVTIYDGGWKTIQQKYPFLHLLYGNDLIGVFGM